MVRKCIILIAGLLLTISALAQSERLYLDVDFNFDFDNTEYSGSGIAPSETLFGISLAPALRYEWNEKHSLGVGVNAQKMFGSVRFLDDINFVAYYQFKSEKYGALAGLFRRDKMLGRYSEAFGVILPYEPMGCIHLEQLVCGQRPTASLRLGRQGGNSLWC